MQRKPRLDLAAVDWNDTINRSLVGCWLLGRAAKDISRYGNNGTTVSSPTIAAGHHGGVAMSFNGSTQYVSVPNSVSLAIASGLTISFWVKPSALTSLASLIARWDEGGGNREWAVTQADGSGNIRFDTSPDGVFNPANTATTTNTPLSTTKWTHVVAMSGNSANAIYINGVLNVSIGPASLNILTAATPITIARATQFGGAANYTSGNIDGVRIYNRALSASEIARLYNEPYAGIIERRVRRNSSQAVAATVIFADAFYPNVAIRADRMIGY